MQTWHLWAIDSWLSEKEQQYLPCLKRFQASNISGRSPNLGHNNSFMLEWPKYHTKIWNRKYCLKKETTFLLIQSFGIQLVPCVNSQILTQTYIYASIHLCLSLLFCSESYRGGNSGCLASDLHNNQPHQDCCTDCNTKPLEFVFQLCS